MQNQVPCTGHKCAICDVIGRPNTILISAIDANTQKPVQLSLSRSKAIELGLLKPDTTVLDDIVQSLNEDCICPSCQHEPPGLCKPDCVCPCHA